MLVGLALLFLYTNSPGECGILHGSAKKSKKFRFFSRNVDGRASLFLKEERVGERGKLFFSGKEGFPSPPPPNPSASGRASGREIGGDDNKKAGRFPAPRLRP